MLRGPHLLGRGGLARHAGLGRGEFRLLYIAPERLGSRAFASLAQELEISLVAEDEAAG